MSNYIYHGTQDLITLPERSVQTFPSGLVRVDRVYACRKNQVARFRDQLRAGNPLPFDDGAPAIDGLFIFPEPSETIRDDGFAEFRVSAYGRANATGTQTLDIVRGNTGSIDFAYTQTIIDNVLPIGTALKALSEPPNIEIELEYSVRQDAIIIQSIDLPKNFTAVAKDAVGQAFFLIGPSIAVNSGGVIVEIQFGSQVVQQLYIFSTGTVEIKSSTSRNFGYFSEYSTLYGAKGAGVTLYAPFVASWEINGSLVGSYA